MDRIEVKAQITVDDAGAITGIAWPFSGPDRLGDVIDKGAFAKALPPLPMLASHDQRDTVGVWEEVSETPEGLMVKGRLLVGEVARADEIRALIKAGAMRGLSIGFASKKAMPRRGGGRNISEIELLEISVVAVPAHPGALITSAKDMPMTTPTDMPDLTALEAKMTGHADQLAAQLAAQINGRIDKIEAKANRPEITAPEVQQTEDRKAFINYLRTGQPEGKALTTAADTPNHILAPEQIETEFLRNLVEYSPIRTIADVRGTTSAKIIIPQRTSVTNALWVGETTPRTGSEPGFAQDDIDVKELATFVDMSLQLSEDSSNILGEVNLALAEDFGQKESLAFVNGSLALEPSGFMTNAAIEALDNGHAANVDPDALISLMYSLPATYRLAGTWVMNGSTLAAVRKLKDGHGNYLWQPSYQVGQPETILGRPVVEAVDMPDIDEDAEPIIFGDFKRGYRIYDRLSLSILADPYTQRANGLVRYHARRRVGAGVVRPTAFRKLAMTA